MIWTVWLFVARVPIKHLARLLDLKWNCIVCVGGWCFGSVWNGVDSFGLFYVILVVGVVWIGM